MEDKDRRERSPAGKATEEINRQEWHLTVGFGNRDLIKKPDDSQRALTEAEARW